MTKIELLAPAKDIQKAKIALLYGADAVYFGGKQFSLRARASNFDIDDIFKITNFAHSLGKKVFVTVNIVFHQEDLEGLQEYLLTLDEIGIDAIIVESVNVLTLAKKLGCHFEVHLSTQINTTNSMAISEYQKLGVDRVVLSREVSMDSIRKVARNTSVPLEVFIHGGMCSNYSGRCILSNRMTLRDANRGGCAQSCRWKYEVYKGNQLISDPDTLFSMSSKDLRASAYIKDMIDANIRSLKIEGRMKSDYYIAQVVKTYRQLIDEIYEKGTISQKRLEYYDSELDKAENRLSDDGFLSGTCDEDKHLYGVNGAGVTHDYVAYVLAYYEGYAKIEVRNYFKKGDELEVFGPDLDNTRFTVEEVFDTEMNNREIINKPMETLYIKVPFACKRHYMIRKA
jgi:putative protease